MPIDTSLSLSMSVCVSVQIYTEGLYLLYLYRSTHKLPTYISAVDVGISYILILFLVKKMCILTLDLRFVLYSHLHEVYPGVKDDSSLA